MKKLLIHTTYKPKGLFCVTSMISTTLLIIHIVYIYISVYCVYKEVIRAVLSRVAALFGFYIANVFCMLWMDGLAMGTIGSSSPETYAQDSIHFVYTFMQHIILNIELDMFKLWRITYKIYGRKRYIYWKSFILLL